MDIHINALPSVLYQIRKTPHTHTTVALALGHCHFSNLAGMSRDTLASNPAMLYPNPNSNVNVNRLTDKRGTPA